MATMATKKKAVKGERPSTKKSDTVTLKLTRDEAQRLYNLSLAVWMPSGEGTVPQYRGILHLPKEKALGLRSIDNIVTDKLERLGFVFEP